MTRHQDEKKKKDSTSPQKCVVTLNRDHIVEKIQRKNKAAGALVSHPFQTSSQQCKRNKSTHN